MGHMAHLISLYYIIMCNNIVKQHFGPVKNRQPIRTIVHVIIVESSRFGVQWLVI